MIRKFFRDALVAPKAQIIPERVLIAEIGLSLLYQEDDEGRTMLIAGGTDEGWQKS